MTASGTEHALHTWLGPHSPIIHLPTFTKTNEWIYNQPDQACINENMANMFTTSLRLFSALPTSYTVRLTYPTMTR